MAKFKVLKTNRDKATRELFKKDETITKSVKYINEHERKLKEAGYELPFFERLDKKGE
ncbi:hypothetical protein [Staphylococcus muscae]|uniref:Uncharacterized protein n=1 Tax=Staphylococcus muscae TaxID=1294 RepID=A0A240BYK2_9STAP|nr:hypothetical protein [Staphylococcus muscae]GGA93201.1 hypothetical protein GCM10007183_16730 [Staphylococcus muscae]SNW00735.1 Uncharacterised protein [Staphylococcus muscae]